MALLADVRALLARLFGRRQNPPRDQLQKGRDESVPSERSPLTPSPSPPKKKGEGSGTFAARIVSVLLPSMV